MFKQSLLLGRCSARW